MGKWANGQEEKLKLRICQRCKEENHMVAILEDRLKKMERVIEALSHMVGTDTVEDVQQFKKKQKS